MAKLRAKAAELTSLFASLRTCCFQIEISVPKSKLGELALSLTTQRWFNLPPLTFDWTGFSGPSKTIGTSSLTHAKISRI